MLHPSKEVVDHIIQTFHMGLNVWNQRTDIFSFNEITLEYFDKFGSLNEAVMINSGALLFAENFIKPVLLVIVTISVGLVLS